MRYENKPMNVETNATIRVCYDHWSDGGITLRLYVGNTLLLRDGSHNTLQEGVEYWTNKIEGFGVVVDPHN